jgi:hypothetical protein
MMGRNERAHERTAVESAGTHNSSDSDDLHAIAVGSFVSWGARVRINS